MENMNLPILIAKDRNARIFKDDYKIGWLILQGNDWSWIVWGSAKNLDGAKKCAKLTIGEKGERSVYLSEKPLNRGIKMQHEELQLIEITDTIK